MNIAFFIARKLALNEKKSFSRFITRLAILAIALSIAIMIIGSSITRGYQVVIENKFFDCWGQIHITPFLTDPSNISSHDAVEYDSNLVAQIAKIPAVKSIKTYTIQSAVIKNGKEIEGLFLKGIGIEKDQDFNRQYLQQGNAIQFNDTTYSSDILISETSASLLNITVGNKLLVYFMNGKDEQPKARKLKVVGIYKTGLEDYDKLFAICDAQLIHHINQTSGRQINGYEIYTHSSANIDQLEQLLFEQYVKEPLQIYQVKNRFGNVFSWLGMMKMNEQIIILIMLIIAIVNMITALLILVLERTPMIGLLKSIGMKNRSIQSIFLFSTLGILSIGLILGTLLGISLSLLQKYVGFIHLDEATYYIKTVPISINPFVVIGINLITIIVCAILLIIPSMIVRNISPTKAFTFH